MKKIASLFLAIVCLPVAAQTSFLGIALDAPFPGEMSQCPTRQDINLVDTHRIKEAGVCFFKESNETYTVYNTPDLGIGHTLNVETYDDKPIIFRLIFNKAKYSQAVDTFTARYGKPQKTYRERIRTAAGGTYEARGTIWDEGKLLVRLDEIGKDIRWSEGVVVNAPLLSQKRKQNKEAAESAAGKL